MIRLYTAIVTGATGFIGKAFIEYLLEKDYQVYGISRNTENLKKLYQSNLICIEADFSAYETLNQKIDHADIFYHFAWEGVYGDKAKDPKIQLKNTEATCEALLQAVKIGCNKFVFAGTIAELEILEYLDRKKVVPRKNCIYAAAKLNTEIMCKILAKSYGIAFNTGLLANTIGPGDTSHRSTNTILSKFLKGEVPQLVKGEGLNDWLYIKDAVRLLEAIGQEGKNMKTYYIGHTELWPLKKIITRAKDIVAPELDLKFGTMPDQFLTNYSYLSTYELYEDTGCKAEYDFDKSVQETAEWLQSQPPFVGSSPPPPPEMRS
ncbi:NAD(P)-dependent oxidoreductase [bacterium 1XD42-1]|nr:NAD(P)-dependent oxidoreductase [bacterium 1XD42-1]